jgi:hypothetical protein
MAIFIRPNANWRRHDPSIGSKIKPQKRADESKCLTIEIYSLLLRGEVVGAGYRAFIFSADRPANPAMGIFQAAGNLKRKSQMRILLIPYSDPVAINTLDRPDKRA